MKTNQQEAERKADEILEMYFGEKEFVPSDLESKIFSRLDSEMTGRKRKLSVFWSGAAAVVLINAFAVFNYTNNMKSAGNSASVTETTTKTTVTVKDVAGYYYSDQTFNYAE